MNSSQNFVVGGEYSVKGLGHEIINTKYLGRASEGHIFVHFPPSTPKEQVLISIAGDNLSVDDKNVLVTDSQKVKKMPFSLDARLLNSFFQSAMEAKR